MQSDKKPITVNWKRVCLPKSVRGLGVLDLKAFNLCLLDKWYWRWRSQPLSSWAVAIQGGNLYQHQIQHNALSAPIKKVLGPLYCNLSVDIGKGKSVSFWYQNWGMGLLAFKFSELCSFAINKEANVAQFMAAPIGTNFREAVATSQTAMCQLASLLLAIQEYPPVTNGLDIPKWRLREKGYSTASFYNFLQGAPLIKSHSAHNWKAKAPPRMKFFMWQMLANKLATIDNLKARGMSLPNMCVLCRQREETTAHLAFQCSFTLAVWDGLAASHPIGDPASL